MACILGLTGSIAMGKSTVAELFIQQGIPVFDADNVVRELYKNAEIIQEIGQHFPEAYTPHSIDRSQLADIVFQHPQKKLLLESILHPHVRALQAEFLKHHHQAPLVVLDIPLLFESHREKDCDKVLVVTAPPAIQKKRALARENMTEARLEAILALQLPDAEKRKRADFMMDTSGSYEALALAVHEIVATLCGK
jgi:dephospho-CoA kinase